MAHWAELDENNSVIRVTVGDNNDPNGDEGYQWLLDNLGGRWVKTSYNGSIRKNFAGQGYYYNEELDAFISPQPYPSWELNTETCQWDPPVPQPDWETEGWHIWNEDELTWVPVSEANQTPRKLNPSEFDAV
jgi:hypothetical protein